MQIDWLFLHGIESPRGSSWSFEDKEEGYSYQSSQPTPTYIIMSELEEAWVSKTVAIDLILQRPRIEPMI